MKKNYFFLKPNIEIIQLINVDDIEWCDEAVLICVKNGKGTLTHRISEEDEDYSFYSQLLLGDKPIIQGKYPICPTCAGMLATGYGIENIHSNELTKVRECINSEYKGIINAVENIKPLLGLLNDGYYVLADAKLYPSDGQGNFFYSVPNELTYNEATCSQYYDSDFYCSADGFPAFIYPTQSGEMIQEQRVEEYIRIMKTSNNPPRGLAYCEAGFVCALLDGHHKACAASVLGKTLNCLTIIPPDSFCFADAPRRGILQIKTRLRSIACGCQLRAATNRVGGVLHRIVEGCKVRQQSHHTRYGQPGGATREIRDALALHREPQLAEPESPHRHQEVVGDLRMVGANLERGRHGRQRHTRPHPSAQGHPCAAHHERCPDHRPHLGHMARADDEQEVGRKAVG